MNPRPPLLIIVGPTAVGKTGLAIGLARRFDAEIVGADSVQIYRGLDVGSAKPTPEEQAQARHHMVDVADPTEQFSAARFAEMADVAIADITGRGKRVILAGGTGLYVRALLHGLATAPPADEEIRANLRGQWDEQGPAVMHKRLAAMDPAAASRLHPNDRQRVLRALEVCQATGRPLSDWQAEHQFRELRYRHALVGLDRPRQELYKRIELRSRLMWDGGLVEETKALLDAGTSPDAHGLDSLGYRQAVAFLRSGMGREEAIAETIKQTKAYAKRQLTWFRGMDGIKWHSPEDIEGIAEHAASLFDN